MDVEGTCTYRKGKSRHGRSSIIPLNIIRALFAWLTTHNKA